MVLWSYYWLVLNDWEQKKLKYLKTHTNLRHGSLHGPPVWHVGGLAVILPGLILSGDFMNGASHLFNSIDSFVRLALANPSFKGADRWALSLYLFPIFHGFFVGLCCSSRCSWKDWEVLKLSSCTQWHLLICGGSSHSDTLHDGSSDQWSFLWVPV